MKKSYAIANFLSDENMQDMTRAANEAGFDISFFKSTEEAAGKVSDAEVIYSGGDASILDYVPNIKWCHLAFAGIDAFAASGVFDSGEVLLTNGSGAYGLTISEHVIMVSLMLLRRMPDYNRIIHERKWLTTLKTRSIAGSKVVIVGTGDIGASSAEKYRCMGAASIMGFNRSGRELGAFDEIHKFDDFDAFFSNPEFAESVDILLICIPASSETRGLISRERINMLSDRTFVINVGRGSTIDQDALLEALNDEKIAGAALDVMNPEPLPKDHPLWDAKNCIITPHISGNMSLKYTVDKTVEFFCENLRRYVSGQELLHRADAVRGY